MPRKKLASVEEPKVDPIEAEAIAAFEAEIEQEADAEEAAEAAKPLSQRQFIVKEFQVDKFNVIRRRVELTPAVCDVCGFDVTERNNLGDYDSMPETVRAQVVEAIAEHKRLVHSPAEKLIINEDEVPTEWLGHPKF
jgi:hypothetical protein